MKKLAYFLFLIIVLVAGCNTKSLPKSAGFYYIDKKNTIKIQPYSGAPESSKYIKFVDVSNKPEFFAMNTIRDIGMFSLYNLITGDKIGYNAVETKNNGVKIKVDSPVADGYYCFSQGDYMAAPTEILHWCFAVGAEKLKAQVNDALKSKLISGLEGAFILTDQGYTPLAESPVYNGRISENDFDSLPISLMNLPIIAIRSPQIDPNELKLYIIRPVVGIGFDRYDDDARVISVDEGCGAYVAGLNKGDRIVAINGVETGTTDQVLAELEKTLRYGSSVTAKVARKAAFYDVKMDVICVYSSFLDEMTATPNQDFYSVTYNSPLRSGFVYCISKDRDKDGYCFIIK